MSSTTARMLVDPAGHVPEQYYDAATDSYIAVTGTGTGLAVSGTGYTSQATVTRPADTTPYTAGDVVGATAAAIAFPSIGPAAGHIIITDVDFRVDVSAVPSGMTSFRLYLYGATPPSALADNAAFDLPSGDTASYLGYLDLGTPVDMGSSLFVQTSGVNKKLKLGATTGLWGYLVTLTGFTPASATVKSIRLNALGV